MMQTVNVERAEQLAAGKDEDGPRSDGWEEGAPSAL